MGDPSQNLSLLQYVGSKLPNGHSNRFPTTNGVSTQSLQQYFTSQQHPIQPKYEVRPTRNVYNPDERHSNVWLLEII